MQIQITTHIKGKNHRLKVVLAINMYTFVKYDARLSLWRVFSAQYSRDHVWRWNASLVQTSPPGEHSLAESRLTLWRAYVSYVYHCAKNSGGFPNTCWKLDTITRQMHAVLVLIRPLPNVDIQKFGMWGMYDLTKAYGNIENPFATLWANIFVPSHLWCGTDSVLIRFCRSHKYFKDAKVMQINRIFENS